MRKAKVDSDLELAILRFPLEEFCEEMGGDPIGYSDEYILTCPKCYDRKLSVNLKKRRWRCFLCEDEIEGTGRGGIFSLIRWVAEISSSEAARYLIHASDAASEAYGEILPDPGFAKVRPKPSPGVATGLPENCLAIDGILPYMSKREISLEDARNFGLRCCTSGWLANRLIFPVWERGQVIYWQARAMWDEPPGQNFSKTLNPSRKRNGILYLGSGDVLLNIETAAQFPRVAITEGPTSAIRCGPSAIATFGKHISGNQIRKLLDHNVSAVDFMWDGPSKREPQGAWPEMIQAAHALAPFMDVRMIFLPEGDPGDYPRAHLQHYRSRAVPLQNVGDCL